jgi:hypothetical protein
MIDSNHVSGFGAQGIADTDPAKSNQGLNPSFSVFVNASATNPT